MAVPFNGTKKQEDELRKVIEAHKGEKGATIPVLHEAQSIYGYLPIEVQKMISEGLDVPLAEIYGIVTFYTQFSLNPKGVYPMFVSERLVMSRAAGIFWISLKSFLV